MDKSQADKTQIRKSSSGGSVASASTSASASASSSGGIMGKVGGAYSIARKMSSSSKTKNTVSLRGVSVRWFIQIVKSNPEMKKVLDSGGRTSDLLPLFMKMTEPHGKISVVDYLMNVKKSESHFVKGRADAFLSHAWEYKLKSLIESFEYMERKNGNRDIFVWFDILCVNQHKAAHHDYDNDFWTVTFHKAINDIGKTVVLMAPWNDPANLRRSWCLWEIYGSTLNPETVIEIVIVPSERGDFRKTLQTKVKEMVADLGKIDATQAKAFDDEDRRRILEAAQNAPGGIARVQESVVKPLREWMTAEAKAVIDELEKEVARDKDKKTTLADMCNKVGVLFYDLGNIAQAQPLYERAIALYKEIYSTDLHYEWAELLNNYGAMLQWKGEREEAKKSMKRALEIHEELSKGKGDSNYATMLDNYGSLLQELEEFEEAITFHEKAIKMESSLPEPSKIKLSGMKFNQGMAYKGLNKMDEALGHMNEALKMDNEAFGAGKVNTQIAAHLYNLGDLYADLEEFDEALVHLKKSLDMDKKIYGHGHRRVAETLNRMAEVSIELNKPEEAKKMSQEALEIAKNCNDNLDDVQISLLERLGNFSISSSAKGKTDCLAFFEKALELRIKNGYEDAQKKFDELLNHYSQLGVRNQKQEKLSGFKKGISEMKAKPKLSKD